MNSCRRLHVTVLLNTSRQLQITVNPARRSQFTAESSLQTATFSVNGRHLSPVTICGGTRLDIYIFTHETIDSYRVGRNILRPKRLDSYRSRHDLLSRYSTIVVSYTILSRQLQVYQGVQLFLGSLSLRRNGFDSFILKRERLFFQ